MRVKTELIRSSSFAFNKLSRSDEITLSGNIIYDNLLGGIIILNSDLNTISRNIVLNNGFFYGIKLVFRIRKNCSFKINYHLKALIFKMH
ncbi:MAG: DUF1565 domain-containing protein [Candidatus Hodarchaeota archaeon]